MNEEEQEEILKWHVKRDNINKPLREEIPPRLTIVDAPGNKLKRKEKK